MIFYQNECLYDFNAKIVTKTKTKYKKELIDQSYDVHFLYRIMVDQYIEDDMLQHQI